MSDGDAALKKLIEIYRGYAPQGNPELIAKAFHFSKKAHDLQQRASKEPYFTHCLAVAEILTDFRLDTATICAGLLHDVLEDTKTNYADLEREFSTEIAALVDGVTKIAHLQTENLDEIHATNWRKMLFAMAKDVRIVLIKLADRLHNMRTIRHLKPENQERIAKETVSLYAPIAERLGMFTIKSELEDHAFAVLDGAAFQNIAKEIEKNIAGRKSYLEQIAGAIEDRLKRLNLPCRIASRPKHLYSIYQKMQRQNKQLPEIEDALGLRIITDTIANCYAILGEAQAVFKPVPGSFTDYISHPKPNLYQSLHTTIYGPGDKIVEIQIRTEEMHKRCEYGIAAHWKYKMKGAEKNAGEPELEAHLNWLRECLQWLQDLKNPEEFMESLKIELKTYQIFVLTPKKDVKALPEDATPVDFAYAIHTDIGNHCFGAKVNGKMLKLDGKLKSGDVCEILTRKNAKPNKEWLTFVKTARARSRIRRALREEEK